MGRHRAQRLALPHRPPGLLDLEGAASDHAGRRGGSGLTFVAAVVVALQGKTVADGAVVLLVAALVFTAPIAIGWRTFQHQTVNGETIMGALCIYVLIGMIFATLDYGIELASGTYFAQPGPHGPADFIYFSYITMATVGYGDLTPAPGLPGPPPPSRRWWDRSSWWCSSLAWWRCTPRPSCGGRRSGARWRRTKRPGPRDL